MNYGYITENILFELLSNILIKDTFGYSFSSNNFEKCYGNTFFQQKNNVKSICLTF